MKKNLLFALTIAVLNFSAAHAACCESDRGFHCCSGSLEVGSELLYMRPSVCDLSYVIDDQRDSQNAAFYDPTATSFVLPFGNEMCVKPEYDWGFRLYASFVCNGYDFKAMYTGLRTRDIGTFRPVGNEVLWPTLGSPAIYVDTDGLPAGLTNSPIDGAGPITIGIVDTFAKGFAFFHYQAVDINVGSRHIGGSCCRAWTRCFVGLHYLNLDFKWYVRYGGNLIPGQGLAPDAALTLLSDVRERNILWGLGPRFGFEGRYDLWCNLGLGGQFSAGILAARSNPSFSHSGSRVETSDTTTVVSFDYNGGLKANSEGRRNSVIPFIDARLGLNYTWRCGDSFSFLAEVGYEFMSYINAISRKSFNDARGTSFTDCDSFRIDGLYVNMLLKL